MSLATAGMELTDTLELRARTPPRPLQLPGLPTKVFVYATGAGCATVQVCTIITITLTYKPTPLFFLIVVVLSLLPSLSHRGTA